MRPVTVPRAQLRSLCGYGWRAGNTTAQLQAIAHLFIAKPEKILVLAMSLPQNEQRLAED